MPILDYTRVPVAKTVAEIEAKLARAKAEAILKEYDSDGTVSALSFRIRTEFGVLTFLLPAIIADNLLSNSPIEIMKADLSTNDFIRIQVVSRLSDLLFDELQPMG